MADPKTAKTRGVAKEEKYTGEKLGWKIHAMISWDEKYMQG